MNGNGNSKTWPPAEGERRAIVGYHNQYCVSAYTIIQHLRNDKLKWIKIADPDAKQLDDFQISNGSRIDAFQIKWGQYQSSFTFKELTQLISQLATGWKHFQEIYPHKKIIVHLLTNDIPSNSTSAKIPFNEPSPTPKHFAAFMEQAWKPFKKKGKILEEWKLAWKELQLKSNLVEEDFKKFAQDCELEFSYNIPIPTDAREKESFVNDMEHVIYKLFQAVADPSRIIKLTYDELMERLNWSSRVEYKNRHEFPVDENLYQPITPNVKELNDSLNNLAGGYIGVFGTPGSGKSTFLSQFLRSRDERVIFYYAYVPDSYDSVIKRGESENFLHDIVLSLNYEGFKVSNNLNLDVNQLSKYFSKQIQLLHKDWKKNGQKTIILIDGLDHIDREQQPRESLLKYLPMPQDVPDGVYFILGSQTEVILPTNIKTVVSKDNHRIIMHSFSKDDVFHIINKTEISVLLTEEQKDKIFYLSGGHPLALSYILNHLHDVTDERQVDNLIVTTEKYEGNIEIQYNSYWSLIENEYELKELIGLLCRLRSYIDMDWIKTWIDRKVLQKFIITFKQYFRIEEDRWYFFHNSFRLFLQEKTGELLPGKVDPDQDREFHHEIAEKCSKTEKNSHWSWEELYHRVKAGEHQKVLKKVSQSYFRDQFFNFRPIDLIKIDINFTLESAAICQDPVALTKLLLINSEIAEREFNLDKKSVISILFNLNEKQLALEYIRDGNRLRIKPKDALELIPKFVSAGLNEESKKVFDLAEPLNILYSPKPIENDYDNKKGILLRSWATSAIYFRDINTIIKTIRQIDKIPDRTSIQQVKNSNPSRSFQNSILYSTGISLLENERWDELFKVLDDFNVEQNDFQYLAYLFVNSWTYAHEKGYNGMAKRLFKKAQKKFEKIKIIDYEMCIHLAEVSYFIFNDEKTAKNYIKDVPQPKLKTNLFQYNHNMEPFMYRFRLNNLLYNLGSTKTPEEIIPDPDDSQLRGIVKFERFICVLASINADVDENNTFDANIINEEFSQIFDLFHMDNREAIELHLYEIKERMGSFCQFIVNIISKHGSNALKSLVLFFEQNWNDEELKKFWPVDVRRQIIVSLINKGIDHSWAVEELNKIENDIWEGYDIFGRVEECLKQSKAWLKLNEKDYAYESLKKMFKTSFGIYHEKDFQLTVWIKWLDEVIEIDPERAEELIIFFAEHIVLIDEYTDVKTCYEASEMLLAVTFRWNPLKALELSSWLMEQRIIDQVEVFNIFIEETLKSEDSNLLLILFSLTHLLFPLSTYSNSNITCLLLQKISEKYGNEKVIEAASYLVFKVRIYAQKGARSNWFYSIKKSMDSLGLNISDADIKCTDIQFDENDGFTYNLLKLKDHTVLDENDVQNKVLSLNELVELLDAETEDSHFNWEPIINKLVKALNYEDILNLSQTIINRKDINDRETSKFISIISKELSTNKDFDQAIELGNKSLNLSDPISWGYWGGNTRLKAFEALVKADRNAFRPKVYKTLVNDLKNGNVAPKTITLNLDQILPLLTDKIPIQEIWPEMEKYIHILFENYPSRDFDPLKFSEKEKVEDNPSIALMSLVLVCLNHPVRFISQMAMHICVNLLLESDIIVQNSLNEFLGEDESYQESIFMILDAVSLKDPSKIEIFREKIVDLHKSPNYLIKRISWILCRRIGCNFAEETNKTIKLPEIYYKQFPDRDILKGLNKTKLPIGQPLSDSSDPVDLIYPYNFHVHVISQISGVPEINLCHRLVQIMNQLDNYESWSKKREMKLRSILSSTGLRFAFNPPRSVLVRRAIFHVISELIDGRILNSYDLLDLDHFFRFYDPSMIITEPIERPSYIEAAYEEYRSQYLTNGTQRWIEEIDNEINKINFKTFDGKFILAENTKLIYLNNERATALRKTKLVFDFNEIGNEANGDSFFHRIISSLYEEYLDIDSQVEPIPLIIQNNADEYDSRGSNWIAFNPIIAYQLGWNLDDSGWFRWVDEENKLMVESIWWMDGLLDQFHPTSKEVGEGWLIVASNDAINAIKSQYKLLKRILEVKCHAFIDNRLVKNNKVVEIKI